MSDAETEPAAERPHRQVDRHLLAEANLYGIQYAAYIEMSPRERGAVKQKWTMKLRAEARRRNVDPDDFVSMSEDAREEARAQYPEVVRPKAPSVRKTRPVEVAEVVDEELSSSTVDHEDDEEEDEETVHSTAAAVPATEGDPKMRTQPTLGDIRPTDNEDLSGWSQPKNLSDVYSRYTIGDGQHFIRVERLEPKVFQQIPCSGYLGEIRERITEEQFNMIYGGRLYMMQVYGPDPKGRRDPMSGLPIIKSKTDPFKYTVPVIPPNLSMLPGRFPTTKQEPRMNSFPQIFSNAQPSLPTTPADATMHKSTLDFTLSMFKEKETLRTELGNQQSAVVAKAIEATERAAASREETLKEQLTAEREARKTLEQKMEKFIAEHPQASPLKDAGEFLKAAGGAGQNPEAQVTRLQQMHAEELTRLREAHRDAVESLKTRHEDELKRNRDRLDDVERTYKTKISDVESRSTERVTDAERRMRERENELRSELERVRADERSVADRRVQEKTEQFNERLADLTKQHERELRMAQSNHDVKTETQKGGLELQIVNLKEKISRLDEELEEAREEARQAGDPVAVMKKAKEQAKLMGYEEKDENAPQTAGERFAAMAGMGLGKAMETMDKWVPEVVKTLVDRPQPLGGPAATPQRRALPPGQGQAQNPARQQRGPSKRAVAWASAGSVPLTEQATIPPDAPSPQPAAAQVQEVPSQQAAPASAPPAAPQPQQEPQQQQAAPQQMPATNRLRQVFPDEIIRQFRAEVEQAINVGFGADMFARKFHEGYPGPSIAMVSVYKPEDLFAEVESMPDGALSPILRRDGRRWVEKLWEELQAKGAPPAAAQAAAQA